MEFRQLWIAAFVLISSCCSSFCSPFYSPAFAVESDVRVRLKNGGFVAGQLAANSGEGNVAIRSDMFAAPLELDVRAIRSIDQLDRNQPNESMMQTFLLSSGSSITGELVAMDDQRVVVKSPSLGEVSFSRALLREFSDSRFEGRLVYSGPRTGADWKSADKPDDWLFEAGSISTSKSSVSVIGDVNLPDKSQVQFSLSWSKTPDFALYLGCPEDPKVQSNAALCLEIWDGVLTMVREVGQNAEIAMVSEFAPENNRLNLVVYLDQVAGIAAVATPTGKLLERIELKADKVAPSRFVKLVSQVQDNSQSVFRLERFEVREWDGHLPSASDVVVNGQIIGADGQAIAGTIGNFNPETGELQILRDGEETRGVKISEIRRAQFQSNETSDTVAKSNEAAASETKTPAGAANEDVAKPKLIPSPFEDAKKSPAKPVTVKDTLIEIELQDRSRLTGKWLSSKEGRVSFEVAEMGKPVSFEVSSLVGLVGSAEPFEVASKVPVSLAPKGRLIGSNCELPGTLAVHELGDLKTLLWMADSFAGPVALTKSSEGKVEFGSRPTTPTTRNRQAVDAQALLLRQRAQRSAALANAMPRTRRLTIGLELRTGDVVEGKVTSINEKGVTFESASTTTKFVPHANLEAVTLRPNRDAVNETPQKLERLMTVPRSMKADPPTHLFVSTNGDYLRGRLVSLDANKTVVEVRLENVEIPTEQLAQIYWLHDREWEKDDKPAKTEDEVDDAANEKSEFQVHVIRKDGRGLTFAPESLNEGKLAGTSQILGHCEQPLAELQTILFGCDVGKQARELKKELWKLSLAQLPKVYQEDEAGAGESQSPLVGKPAPEFQLEAIDGSTFKLSQQAGKVIVLDFWASWCGPCMKSMPEVDRVVKEVGGDQVELVAVNLQEGKERINTALGRLAITANVLMDIDGEVAQQYEANAIPQTVIVDRNGNITHLFVGGGPKFVEQFATALKATIEAK